MAKERTIVYRVTFNRAPGDSSSDINVWRARHENFGGMAAPAMWLSDPSWIVTFSGLVELRFAQVLTDIGNVRRLSLSINFLPTGPFPDFPDYWNTYNDVDTHDETILPATDYVFDFDGADLSLTVVVEEYDASTTTGLFPSWGGTLKSFGPKHNTLRPRERLKLGSNLVVSGSAGSLSVSATVPITAAKQLDISYGINRQLLPVSWPYASGLRCQNTITVDAGGATEEEVKVGSDVSASNSGHVYTCTPDTSTGEDYAFAPGGATTGPTLAHMTIGQSPSFLRRCWEFYPYVRTQDGAYPDTLVAVIDRHNGDMAHATVITPDGTLADQYEQRRYSAAYSFHTAPFLVDRPFPFPPTPYGSRVWTNIESGSGNDKSEQEANFRVYLQPSRLSDLGEDPDEWHYPVLERAYDTGTVEHLASATVMNGSEAWTNDDNVSPSNAGGEAIFAVAGGAGQAHHTFVTTGQERSPQYDFQAFRTIVVRLKADAASKPFTIRESDSGKSWSGTTHATPNTYSNHTFDLCVPHNTVSPTDSTQSRYPVTSSPGDYFGLTFVTTLYLEELEDGVTYTLDSIAGARGSESLLSCGLPYAPWLDNGVGSNYLIHIQGLSKKKALEIPGFADASGTYGTPSITDLYTALNWRPGITGTIAGSFVDALHDAGQPLYNVGGFLGVIWDGSGFVPYVDLDFSTALSLLAQSSWYEVDWYPYCGDLHSEVYGKFTQMRCGKIFDSAAGVMVADNISDTPASGVDVSVSGGASPAEIVTTDADGYAISDARKYGDGAATLGTESVLFEFFNRWLPWAGFASIDVAAGDEISLVRDYTDRQFIMMAVEGEMITLSYDNNDETYVVYSIDETPTCTHPFFCLFLDLLIGTYLRDDVAKLAQSYFHGANGVKGSSWTVTTITNAIPYDALTSVNGIDRMVIIGHHTNDGDADPTGWYVQVGLAQQNGTFTWATPVEITTLTDATSVGDLIAREDAVFEFGYLDTSGVPHITQCYALDRDGEGDWVETIAVTDSIEYDAFRFDHYIGHIVIVGHHTNDGDADATNWYVQVGMIDQAGDYVWSLPVEITTLTDPSAFADLVCREDGTLELAYLETDGTPHVVRCYALDVDGVGDWV